MRLGLFEKFFYEFRINDTLSFLFRFEVHIFKVLLLLINCTTTNYPSINRVKKLEWLRNLALALCYIQSQNFLLDQSALSIIR